MLYSEKEGQIDSIPFFSDPRKGKGHKSLNLLNLNIRIYSIGYWDYEILLFTELLPNIKNYTEKEMPDKSIIAEKRNYRVKIVEDAKKTALQYLKNIELSKVVTFGLPEIGDRCHCWCVPFCAEKNVMPLTEGLTRRRPTLSNAAL